MTSSESKIAAERGQYCKVAKLPLSLCAHPCVLLRWQPTAPSPRQYENNEQKKMSTGEAM